MRVANIMLSADRGGIETSFAHYAEALREAGAEVLCVVAPEAEVVAQLPREVEVATLAQSSQYDLRAVWRLHRLLQDFIPQVVLVHGKRAQNLARLTQILFGKRAPLVAVLHRHRFKGLRGVDTILCITPALREEVIATGIPAQRVEVLPNFLLSAHFAPPKPHFHTPPVIGFLGRLVEEKGCALLLQASALLMQREVAFTLRIGGSGALQEALRTKASVLGLEGRVTWCGWVEDTASFFTEVDIFCSPSRHESFGIVLLEAFRHGVPVVATRTVGAESLITSGENGLLSDISAEALADALQDLLSNLALAQRMAEVALAHSEEYLVSAVAPKLDAILQRSVQEYHASFSAAGRYD